MNVELLENRLRVMDLRLPQVGEHLDDERLACLVGGAEPSPGEAAHLAGCDVCIELMEALGEGWERLATEQPALAEHVLRPPQRTPRRAPWLVVVAGLCAASAAAAMYGRSAQAPLAEALGGLEARLVAEAHPHRALEGPRVPVAAAPDAPPARVEQPAEPPAPVEQPTPVEPPAPVQVPSTGEVSAVERAEPRSAVARPARAEVDLPETGPDARLTARGPAPMERLAVAGPPRGFGFLRLGAKPNALVFVDGEPFGWTPLVDHRLPEGPHDIRLVFESPLAAKREERFRVVIEPDRVWRSLRVNLRK